MSAHRRYETNWGDMVIYVSADWGQASCPVVGDDRGRQVADFRHDWRRALRAQLEEAARTDGMGEVMEHDESTSAPAFLAYSCTTQTKPEQTQYE